MTSVAVALAACIAFGVSDFLGGTTSRRLAPLTVLLVAQTTGLVLIGLTVLVFGGAAPDASFLPYAFAYGAVGVIGVAALWRGLAVGMVSIVAPIAAAAALIPVLVSLAEGERPAMLQVVGMACVVVGVILVARSPDGGGAERGGAGRGVAAGVGFGLVAAVCFGSLIVFLDEAASEDVLWAALGGRIAAVVLVVVAVIGVRHPIEARREDLPGLLAIGAIDMAANVLMAAATTVGLLSVASVLISLHILVTMGLARVVLQERLVRVQRIGVVAATVGAVILSAA
ncbi:MAG: hypothetical protein QOD71_492 [Thermoleophilaceae bacterium]|jgi:drug/metabolite transporter (DMT)-like permease|nr:hypothetical protein [Thermoleophilaceae bacterium]